ncbi:hypothetical protein [Pseudomonas huanghezhanensis]|uniref:hypothetical protein n=1 Tax=Pseudomonas huanghezhanensis TaxID=3002903 RepID=UPI002285575C|nr:hypothetical protein [Pseudomonas sp. BSw22131]
MQPARQDLPVTPGTTYRDTIRIMQPEFVYRDIAGIAGAPVLVKAVAHGLEGAWPVWARGVQGMPDLNREPFKQLPHRAKVIDVDTLEINAMSASGLKPTGGQLIYRRAVDLAEASGALSAYRGDELLFVLGVGTGLAITTAGTFTRELTAAQTAMLTGEGLHYTFDVIYGGVTVTRYAEGGFKCR